MKAPPPAQFEPNLTDGIVKKATRVVIFGDPKVGKTTWAASAPKPLFLDLERGSEEMNVSRVTNIDSWSNLMWVLRDLIARPKGFKTIVLDTIDRAEWLAQAHVIAVDRDGASSIETACGGYGKGYTAVYELFRALLKELEVLYSRGVNIIFVSHQKVEKVPTSGMDDHERWTLATHQKVTGLLVSWCDAVLYARTEVLVSRAKKGERARAFGDRRVIETVRSPAWVAGNRYGLPAQLDLVWGEFARYVFEDDEARLARLSGELEARCAKLAELLDEQAANEQLARIVREKPVTASALQRAINAVNEAVETAEQSDGSTSADGNRADGDSAGGSR